MRIVLDSNVVLSAILWSGTTRGLFGAAVEQRITLLTSAAQLAELERVASRRRFEHRMTLHRLTPRLLVQRYSQIATLVVPADIGNVVLTDPDDDLVLAAALGGNAELIVSGDPHLLNLKHFQRIPIVSPAEAIKRIPTA